MARDIFTLDSLSEKLVSELSWRRKELTVYKSKIPLEFNPLQSAMLRSAIPLLYAHWEGYIKSVTVAYLEYVSNKALKHNELTNTFITLSLNNKLGELNINNVESKTKIVKFLLEEFGNRANVPKKNIINTKSNLHYDVLKEILFILDLNDNHIDNNKSLINDLVNTRNHIAHGEYMKVDYLTYLNFHDAIINLMEFIKIKIENNAALEKYKRVV